MIYTAQFLVLHSLCWAIPDRRYFAFAISNLYLFVMLAVVNVVGYLAVAVWGVHSYIAHSDTFKSNFQTDLDSQ